ncbi:MAG: hypothetical protein JW762_01485 [Dehalococcoidales bacterium]|nr:hypothetical protein [Dehalococcoidales bacterium]
MEIRNHTISKMSYLIEKRRQIIKRTGGISNEVYIIVTRLAPQSVAITAMILPAIT